MGTLYEKGHPVNGQTNGSSHNHETSTIAIERIIDATPMQVFEAWLSPEILKQWWGPRSGQQDWATPYAETDPRPGGDYRICIRSPWNEDFWTSGRFGVIEPGRRLEMTRRWETGPGSEPAQSVSVGFSAIDEKTRLQFHISGFASPQARDSELEGWHECLDRLVQHFSRSQQREQDEADLRRLAAEWSRALEAKDIEGLTASCSDDILLFDCKPPHQVRGADEYRANWKSCLPVLPDRMKSEHRDLTVTVDGNVAFAHCLHRIVPVDEAHPTAPSWMRVTIGYRRIDGEWKATHEHVSLPFDPATGEAVWINEPDVFEPTQ